MDLHCYLVLVSLLCSGRHIGSYADNLKVNIRNGGGEKVQETISANTVDDTVNLEFTKSDGTSVTQFIDFRSVSLSVKQWSSE